jgi:hypothetical protein
VCVKALGIYLTELSAVLYRYLPSRGEKEAGLGKGIREKSRSGSGRQETGGGGEGEVVRLGRGNGSDKIGKGELQ